MRSLIQFLLSIALASSSLAQASSLSRTPDKMISLYEEYLKHVKSTQPGPVWLEYGRQKMIARSILPQFAAMEPDQFNGLLLLMMDRYINKPDERSYLFNFLGAVSESISADLEYTRNLQNGPLGLVLEGSYKWGVWVLIGMSVSYQVAYHRNIKGLADFMKRLREQQVALSNVNKYYGLGYRVATSPTTWITASSTALGMVAGGIEHAYMSMGTHRHNPMVLMMVLQAQLACHLSFQALALEEEFESIKADEGKVKAAKPELLKKIADVASQATELGKQYNRLENLEVRDRKFLEVLKQYPESESFKKYRSALATAETAQETQCRRMSTKFMVQELTKLVIEIKGIAPDEETPPQPAPVEIERK